VKRRVPGVIVLSGSEGGVSRPNAALVASHGYHALALAYFGFDKLPSELERIPVETVDRAVEWLRAQPGVDPNRIVLMGASKGAELALVAASMNKHVAAVIANSPSSLVYEGVGSSKTAVSSWTSKGADLAFAPYARNETYTKSRRLIDLYNPTFDGAPASSRIAVEKIAGPILLISGKADALWPSSRMADEITSRLRGKAFRYDVTNLQFDDVGHHAAGVPLRPTADSVRLGGSARSIAQAQIEAWRAIVTFLSKLKS
jgi:dienelactone hydrolase